MPFMNIVDVVILAFAAIALASGYRQGLLLTLGQYAGLLAGLVGGAALAPHVLAWTNVSATPGRILIVVVVIMLSATVGHRIGDALMAPFSLALRRLPVADLFDHAGGAAVSVVIALVVAWAAARTLANSPGQPAQLIQQSVVVRRLDAIAPPAPDLLTHLQQVLTDELGPNVFIGLEPELPSSLGVDPSSIDGPGVAAAARSVVRIEGKGCGGRVSGSGFPIGPEQVLTNAHVVAGTRQTTVVAQGAQLSGQVILFDPERDIAIIQVPGLAATPLQFGEASRGARGAVIGYPGGGPERVVPAVVEGRISARGEDIFAQNGVTRDVLVVGADIRPGNSGGPLVDANGVALGVVFARSVAHPGAGFALTAKEIAPDLQSLSAGQPIFDSGRFQCASQG